MVSSRVVETAPGQETVPQTEAELRYVQSQESLLLRVSSEGSGAICE
jgi:hypothetical protein